MPASTPLSRTDASSINVLSPVPLAHNESDLAALEAARLALAAYVAQPADPTAFAPVPIVMRTAATVVGRASRKDSKTTIVATARELAREVNEAGIAGRLYSELGGVAMELNGQTGWPELLACMLVQPAWKTPAAPAFEQVPDWMWGDYSAWVFTPPPHFASSLEWDRYFTLAKRLLSELNRWISRNLGSAAVRAAADAYLSKGVDLRRAPPNSGWRELVEVRGQVLTRLCTSAAERFEPEIVPRDSRRLRIGFVQENFGPSSETYSALPCFEQLDSQSFETLLFALTESDAQEAGYCAKRAQSIQTLPIDLEMRLERLRAENLDVLVFSGVLGASFDEVTRLALHRIAPLQVLNDRGGGTSGLPEIDLYVSGMSDDTAALAAAFTERLGLLRGPAKSFNFIHSIEPSEEDPTRETLQLPTDVLLMGAVVPATGVCRETLAGWTEVLSRTENAKLLIAYLDGDGGAEPSAFCEIIDKLLVDRKISSDRVIVFPVERDSIADVPRLLRLTDVFLDAAADSSSLWVAQALRVGLPVVALGRTNAGAQLLRSVKLDDLVTESADQYSQIAAQLVADQMRRSEVVDCIKSAVASGPDFLDTLAASDAFGALIETAFDELAALGRRFFRAAQDTLSCFGTDNPAENVEIGLAAIERSDLDAASFESTLALRSDPGNPLVRLLRGQVLLAQGNASRAVDYLLATVERAGGKDTRVWFALAQALRANDQTPQAVQALEACLRIDGKHVEALLLLHELAKQVGGAEIAEETRQYLRQIAPDDYRVVAMG